MGSRASSRSLVLATISSVGASPLTCSGPATTSSSASRTTAYPRRSHSMSDRSTILPVSHVNEATPLQHQATNISCRSLTRDQRTRFLVSEIVRARRHQGKFADAQLRTFFASRATQPLRLCGMARIARWSCRDDQRSHRSLVNLDGRTCGFQLVRSGQVPRGSQLTSGICSCRRRESELVGVDRTSRAKPVQR